MSRQQCHEYVDIAAVRIQQWIGRTQSLRLRRGASTLLEKATAADAWPPEQLPPGWRLNPEAGDLSGVISLLRDTTSGGAETVTEVLAVEAARAVATKLRQRLPYLHLAAVLGEGATYADARKGMDRRRDTGELLVDCPPSVPETMLAARCDWCGDAPAFERRHDREGERRSACIDCALRDDEAGSPSDPRPERMPGPERNFLNALAEEMVACPDEFKDLARLLDTDGTQLATIYADGNRVGDFLAAAASAAGEPGAPTNNEIVPVIDTATKAALARAAAAHLPVAEVLRQGTPVREIGAIVHVAGGDDVVVTVPATDGWAFVRGLLTAFGTELGGRTGVWPTSVRELMPTLSAGLVFHHFSFPFSQVMNLAKKQLKAAKEATEGRSESVAFLDITEDGECPPPRRRPLRLADLEAVAPTLDEIAALAPAARHEYLRLCAAAISGRSSTELLRKIRDNGHEVLHDRVRNLDVRSAAPVEEVGRLLDLARWWPGPGRDE